MSRKARTVAILIAVFLVMGALVKVGYDRVKLYVVTKIAQEMLSGMDQGASGAAPEESSGVSGENSSKDAEQDNTAAQGAAEAKAEEQAEQKKTDDGTASAKSKDTSEIDKAKAKALETVPEQYRARAEKLSTEDIKKASSIIFSKLSRDKISQIMAAAKGGFTKEEKQEILNIVRSSLTSAEYAELISIYNKTK